jgi:hypothetical protein
MEQVGDLFFTHSLSSPLSLFVFFSHSFLFDSSQWSVLFSFVAYSVLTANPTVHFSNTARQYTSVDRYIIIFWDLAVFVASGPT